MKQILITFFIVSYIALVIHALMHFIHIMKIKKNISRFHNERLQRDAEAQKAAAAPENSEN